MKLSSDCSLHSLRGHHVLVYYDADGQHLLEINESLALLFHRAESGPFTAESLAPVLEERYGLPHDVAETEAQKAIELWTQYRLTEP